MMTNRASKRFLRQHPNVGVAAAVGLTTYALTAGYDTYYSMLGTSPGDVGRTVDEIPFAAVTAALPLLTAFLAGAALLMIPMTAWFHLALVLNEAEREEGRTLAWVCLSVSALGGVSMLAAWEHGGSRWPALLLVAGAVWAGRRRVTRLGWERAFYVRDAGANLALLWCAALAHAAIFFAAFGITLWLVPDWGRPVVDGLVALTWVLSFVSPMVSGWWIGRRHRRDRKRPNRRDAVQLTAAALAALLLLSPLTVGRFNAEVARRGGAVGLLPGIGNGPTICVEPRWQASAPSPLPDGALLHLGDNDGRAVLYRPKHGPIPVPANAVVLLPVSEARCHVPRSGR